MRVAPEFACFNVVMMVPSFYAVGVCRDKAEGVLRPPMEPDWRSRDRRGIIPVQLAVVRMSIFSSKSGLAWIAAMLCLGAPAAHAQASPINYWIPGWPMGFSGVAGEGA